MNSESPAKLVGKISLSFLAFALIVLTGLSTGSTKASAANLSLFDAGNIISDANFFNGNALSSDQVQAFLNARVPNCTINSGLPGRNAWSPLLRNDGSQWSVVNDSCLRDYLQYTPNMAAQPGFCDAYISPGTETAAQIIAHVGRVCNVSQKVLLVLLEKEQSLITDSWPALRQLDQATGFACYDNGQPCVTDFAGFFYQVWSAARQFQRYGSGSFTWYPVGAVSNISYQANAPQCGTKAVLIQNRATAALYYYTPYTPNAAALAAGYGVGDACSAYGNRNFFQLYTDWFGSTVANPAGPHVVSLYNYLGGSAGFLGQPVTSEGCGLIANGCFQHYTNGSVYWSPDTGEILVRPETLTFWGPMGYQNGRLGYPIAGPTSTSATTYTQAFQGGTINITNGSGSLR